VVGDSCCTLRVTESSSSDPDRQAAPHLHCACCSPCGTAVLFCDLGADCVYVCSFSPASGHLQLLSSCAIGSGSGPRHLVWHPLHIDTVFVANELDNSISLCHWDSASLALTVTSSLPLLPRSIKHPCAAAAIVTSADGRFVYVSVRGLEMGPNCISRFSFERADSGGGSLHFLGLTSSLGSCPRGMVHSASNCLCSLIACTLDACLGNASSG
jgi:6-phosphogluconolactonase